MKVVPKERLVNYFIYLRFKHIDNKVNKNSAAIIANKYFV